MTAIYRTPDVCAAFGLNRNLERYLGPAYGSGFPREISERQVFELAIFKALITSGLSRHEALRRLGQLQRCAFVGRTGYLVMDKRRMSVISDDLTLAEVTGNGTRSATVVDLAAIDATLRTLAPSLPVNDQLPPTGAGRDGGGLAANSPTPAAHRCVTDREAPIKDPREASPGGPKRLPEQPQRAG